MEAEARDVLTASVKTERPPKEEIERRVRRAQDMVRTFVPPGVSLVEELLAERRWEAACEDAELNGKPRPPRSDFVKDG
jgi:hypothetical protein